MGEAYNWVVSICLKERVRPSLYLRKEESFYRFQSSFLWSSASPLVFFFLGLPKPINNNNSQNGSLRYRRHWLQTRWVQKRLQKVVVHQLQWALLGAPWTSRCRQEVRRENQGPQHERCLDGSVPLEPYQVARSFHFRHSHFPLCRYRRQPDQEAVQIRRQGEVKTTREKII